MWRGIGVALVTLFDGDLAVDVDATAAHAARLVDLGVRAVLVCGSTGEADALTDAERATWDRPTYTGSAVLTGYAGYLGAAGAILAVANAVPEDAVAAFDGDASAQRRLYGAHLAGRDRFPYGLKELVAKRFGTATASRLG